MLVLNVRLVQPGGKGGGNEAGREGDRDAFHELDTANFVYIFLFAQLQQPLHVGRGALALHAQQSGHRIVRHRPNAEIPVRPQDTAFELRLRDERAPPLSPHDQALVLEVAERTAQRAATHAKVPTQIGL